MVSPYRASPLPLPYGRAPKGPYGRAPKGPLLNSRACLRILDSRAPTGPHHRNGEPLPGLSLTVEPLPVRVCLLGAPLK